MIPDMIQRYLGLSETWVPLNPLVSQLVIIVQSYNCQLRDAVLSFFNFMTWKGHHEFKPPKASWCRRKSAGWLPLEAVFPSVISVRLWELNGTDTTPMECRKLKPCSSNLLHPRKTRQSDTFGIVWLCLAALDTGDSEEKGRLLQVLGL